MRDTALRKIPHEIGRLPKILEARETIRYTSYFILQVIDTGGIEESRR